MHKAARTEYPPIADPVIGWLCHRWKWNDWQVIGLIMAVSAILMLGFGSLASQQFTGPGRNISSLDNISFILAWILIFLPLIWEIYLWQVRAVAELFDKLRDEEIFGRPNAESSQKVATEGGRILARLTQPWVYLLVLLLLVGFWSYETNFGWPQQFRANGPQYWREVSWYFPIHVFCWTVGLYGIFTLAIRQAIITAGLSSVLEKFSVTVKAFDPDEAGGLGYLGDFIKTSIVFVIGIGVLAALFAVEVAMAGSNILQRFDVLGLFVIYLVLAPLCLIVPTAQARRAMLRARQQALEPIAAQIQETFKEAHERITNKIPTGEIERLNERLAALQKHYDLVLQTFPVTPMTIRSLRSISITATLPLISGIISIVLQLLK